MKMADIQMGTKYRVLDALLVYCLDIDIRKPVIAEADAGDGYVRVAYLDHKGVKTIGFAPPEQLQRVCLTTKLHKSRKTARRRKGRKR